jgi:hypothetical protein
MNKKSNVYINTIVWNPEGAKWICVAKTSYGSNTHRRKRLLLASITIGALCWLYTPLTSYKHQTYDLVKIAVPVGQVAVNQVAPKHKHPQ